MSSLLKRRVEERIAILKTNAFEVARVGELERNFVNDILNGKKLSVRGPNLLKLARALRCPADYLINEHAESPDDSDLGVGVGGEPPSDAMPDLVAVPEYDVRLSMGPGALIGEEPAVDVWNFSRRYIVNQLRVQPANLAVVEVIGDSMMPTLWPGDRVLIDHTDINPGREGIFAVWDGDATVVKRVERDHNSSERRIVLISDNKSHNQYSVDPASIKIIGRVVWYARRL